MKMFRYLFLAATLVFPVVISASPCGTDGLTVVKADSGARYVLYAFREGPDIAFQLPGKEISFPSSTSGRKMFEIDGIVFETLFVKKINFLKENESLTDVDLLVMHKDHEFAYIKTTPSPLTKLVEHGPRLRPGGNGQPSFTFYLWQIVSPQDQKGTSQYFLTTVSGGEVVVLSAIVPNAAKEDVVMSALQSYAESFQHVLRKEQCPQEKKK